MASCPKGSCPAELYRVPSAMPPRRRLRAAEQRSLLVALREANQEAAPLISELHRIAQETVLPSVPEDAQDEAFRAWVNEVMTVLMALETRRGL